MSRIKKDSQRVYPAGAVDGILVVQSVLNARKPPGAVLCYDGRLATMDHSSMRRFRLSSGKTS